MLKYAQNYAQTTPNSTLAYLITSLWSCLCKFFRERRTTCVLVVKPHHSFLSGVSHCSPTGLKSTPCAPVCAAPHRGAAAFPNSPCCATHTTRKKKKSFSGPHMPPYNQLSRCVFFISLLISLS